MEFESDQDHEEFMESLDLNYWLIIYSFKKFFFKHIYYLTENLPESKKVRLTTEYMIKIVYKKYNGERSDNMTDLLKYYIENFLFEEDRFYFIKFCYKEGFDYEFKLKDLRKKRKELLESEDLDETFDKNYIY